MSAPRPPRPPRPAAALLAALTRPLGRLEREEILGDLAEAHAAKHARAPLRADLWYWAQVLLVPAWLLGAAAAAVRFDPRDVTRSVRGLVRSPGFTVVAVASLGMGIGATTAITGALHALLFTPLPVERPEEIELVYHSWPESFSGSQYGSNTVHDPADGLQIHSNLSYPVFRTMQAGVPAEVSLAGYAFVRELSVRAGDAPALATSGMLVSGNYFSTLGLSMHLGRPLTPADDRPGAPRVAVLSHGFWLEALGGDPDVVGTSVVMNEERFEIVGVAQRGYVGLSPGGFFGPSDVIAPLSAVDVFLSSLLPDVARARSAEFHWLRAIARVPASDVGRVRDETTALGRNALVEHGVITGGEAGEVHFRLLDGRRGLDSLDDGTRRTLWILGAIVTLVLLIACANLATLMLARGAARAPELAVRRALGASRWQLAGRPVAESLMLGAAGSALGLLIALRIGPLVIDAFIGSATETYRYEVNRLLLAAAAVGGVLAALLSGVAPVVRTAGTEPRAQMGGRSRSGGRFGMGRGLIAAQIAISVPLVVGAGLFLRTLGNLASVDPGFDPTGVVVFRANADFVTDDPDREQAIYDEMLERLTSAPGVRSAAIVENVLLSGWISNRGVEIDGEEHSMYMNAVSPDFFDVMRIPIRSGRSLQPSDGPGAPSVVLVNETAERQLFGGRAVGRRFTVGSREVEVVGVVADAKYYTLRGDAVDPTFYDPYTQRPGGLFTTNFVVRAEEPGRSLEPVIRDVVTGVAAGMPVSGYRTQSEEMARQAARERIFARLLSGFGAFALLLSCIGLHGITAFAISQRQSEMGVRLALGAAPVSIVRMVLAQVLRVTVVGLVLGVVLAVPANRIIRSMLFGVEPHDVVTLVGVGAVMAGVALVAGWVPARRASRVDPLKSLAPSG